ncbi:MAG: hypothetical protein VYA69_05430 [Gemmatimonadota bacterium]|nr:hypothetical protein [Gemmatimonadota bacterium]
MATRTFNLFTLDDGISGLKRALAYENIPILDIEKDQSKAFVNIVWNDNTTTIELVECESQNHPLAKLGHVFSVVATISDDVLCDRLDRVLTMAFLRGGG